MRKAKISRKTKETSIDVEINLDGKANASVDTGIPFLDHMLTAMATHGVFDLKVKAKGDLEIDNHHTNEDIGLAIGEAFDKALGDRKGLVRMGYFYVPMDEAQVRVCLDFSGRGMLVLKDDRPRARRLPLNSSANYQWQDAKHLLESFARTAKMTLHINVLAGDDFHHTLEAAFKGVGRSLEMATRKHPRVSGVPSSKGTL